MTEEPYRWLEAIANRREYVQGQLTGGSPVFAARLDEGVLLLGVGTGHSKVFEIFDRQALAGLGHPADLERLRQAIIDAAHLEAFTRSPEDVTLRRLVAFDLGPQLKTAFEQIFAPPFLARLLLAEVGSRPADDVLVKLDFDGTFEITPARVRVVADDREAETAAERWLGARLEPGASADTAVPLLLAAWHHLVANQPLPETSPDPAAIAASIAGRTIEAALLRRQGPSAARFRPLPAPVWAPPG